MDKKGWFFLLMIFIGTVIFTLTYHPPQAWGKEVKNMTNERSKQALMIIAHKDFRDEEIQEPKAILEKNGLKVIVASSGIDQAEGILGLRYKPDLTISSPN